MRSTIKATVRAPGVYGRPWANARGSGEFNVLDVLDDDMNKVQITLPDRGPNVLPLAAVALLVADAEVDIVVDTEPRGGFLSVNAVSVEKRGSVRDLKTA